MISRLFAGVYGQGPDGINRHTLFGMFGGGDANICMPCINICGTSGGNRTPGGNGGSGSPPGRTTAPGGNTVPGGNTTAGGCAGKSVV